MKPLVVIVGPPGAGKTTIGTLVSEHLGSPFRDTDTDVERTAGTTIADLFVDYGEDHFRALECAAVDRALVEHDGVLALGGGAILSAATRELLAAHRVLFLDVHVKDAAARIGFNRDRPLLLGNPRAKWLQLMEKRRPLYTEVATRIVTTDGRTPDDITKEVIGWLEEP